MSVAWSYSWGDNFSTNKGKFRYCKPTISFSLSCQVLSSAESVFCEFCSVFLRKLLPKHKYLQPTKTRIFCRNRRATQNQIKWAFKKNRKKTPPMKLDHPQLKIHLIRRNTEILFSQLVLLICLKCGKRNCRGFVAALSLYVCSATFTDGMIHWIFFPQKEIVQFRLKAWFKASRSHSVGEKIFSLFFILPSQTT